MDPQTFFIPKQTDEGLLIALTHIRSAFANESLRVRVCPHHGAAHIDIAGEDPVKADSVAYVVAQASEVMPNLYLLHSHGGTDRTAVSVRRAHDRLTDEVTVHWDSWAAQLPTHDRSPMFVKALALARKHFKAVDATASLVGTGDNNWTRYRDAQQLVLNSLQETSRTVLVDANRRITEAEASLKLRYSELERELQEKASSEGARLATEHGDRLKALEDREAALAKREQSFNTKEARFVARQGQQQQIDDITKWLEGWSLTKGTTRKWSTVTGIYAFALVVTGLLTWWFGSQSFEILKAADLRSIMWWQWSILALKSMLPAAALMTFLVYFIRWISAWAREHAEEEFRNRARLLDIGRSAWLLEAVRDAQDNDTQLPPELVKELSKNLFVNSAGGSGGDLYPQAFSEALMQGLASIRLKTPDGTEIEAQRGKAK